MRLRQTITDRQDSGSHQIHSAAISANGRATAHGDDLIRARHFSAKAETEMKTIIAANRQIRPGQGLAKGRDPVWLCDRLTIIQKEAKRARARAIYRSAQDVLGLIQRCNDHMPIDWTRVDGRLFVLNKLLAQYQGGLAELDADLAENLNTDAPKEAAESSKDPRQILTDLLPHASSDERVALTRLIHLDPTPEILKADAEPQEDQLDTIVEDNSETEAPACDRIEWIMPDLVQNLLEVGREYGKIFSVSHSLDHILIESGASQSVRDRLFARLSDIVASDLPLQGVGRLDICAGDAQFLISGSGFDTFAMAFPEHVQDWATASSDPVQAPNTPDTPTPKPRITDETETDLRAQLAALMDGGAV